MPAADTDRSPAADDHRPESSHPCLDADGMREFAGQFATGVSVITACDARDVCCGLTVNAVTSLSLDPPLYLACLDNDSNTLAAVRDSGAFGVNLLRAEQRDVSDRFAGKGPDKFEGIGYRRGHLGVPVLTGTLASAVCRVAYLLPGGDHHIVVGTPETYEVGGGRPLLYFRGRYLDGES
ncbi:flavin reductase family protein [Salinisphaera sp. PC39]|uniref:flavin reductase family protein n=1 Tax=Salinisphaera sp. PC39 TaxID=1304156 RepID=UPI00333F0DDB